MSIIRTPNPNKDQRCIKCHANLLHILFWFQFQIGEGSVLKMYNIIESTMCDISKQYNASPTTIQQTPSKGLTMVMRHAIRRTCTMC